MKKLLSLILVLSLLLVAGSALASEQNLSQQPAVNPATQEVTIAPLIEAFDPGMINLQISWTNPTLKFSAVNEELPMVKHYVLNAEPGNGEIPFTLNNTSTSSSTTGTGSFSGKLKVVADLTDSSATILTGVRGIKGAMTGPLTEIAAQGTDSANFKFTYSNVENFAPEDNNTCFNDSNVKTTSVVQELNVKITFTVTPVEKTV